MALTVDWRAFYGGESDYVPRNRYPQPIEGFVCKRCLFCAGRKSHGCADLTCSCECPELADKLPANVVPDQQFDGDPFHGRRHDIDEMEFMYGVLPRVHSASAHRMHRIARTPWAHKRSSVNPYLWRLSLRMHDHLIYMACSRPSSWRMPEIKAMWDADKEIAREARWRYAEASRVAKAFQIPLYQSGQKWNVLRALIAQPADSLVLASVTGLPLKHVSAWLSVLESQGFVQRLEEVQVNKAGRKNIIWEACLTEVMHLTSSNDL